jgi:hypothetical protein
MSGDVQFLITFCDTPEALWRHTSCGTPSYELRDWMGPRVAMNTELWDQMGPRSGMNIVQLRNVCASASNDGITVVHTLRNSAGYARVIAYCSSVVY